VPSKFRDEWCLCLLLLAAPVVDAQVLAGHDYDPVSDAVVSWRIEPDMSAAQSFLLASVLIV
jgi:hypothetical protein